LKYGPSRKAAEMGSAHS